MPTPVVAAVIESNGRYLVCQRPTHKRHGGLFEFPGGKVNQDETVQEAVVREMREELDVEVTEVGDILFSVADPGSQFVIEFLQAEIRGTPRAVEHECVLWCTPPELLRLRLAPSDLAFVRRVLASS
jgi:mutator protein MutT